MDSRKSSMWVPLLTSLIAWVDQGTKLWIRLNWALGESRPVWPGFFHLTYVRNTGAAWGLLGGQNQLLVVFSLVVLAFLLVFRRSLLTDSWVHRTALGLLLGGILGNLLDRVRLGYVVDFLDFHYRGWHFPAFNVADMAICTGIFLYLISARREPTAAPGADSTKP